MSEQAIYLVIAAGVPLLLLVAAVAVSEFVYPKNRRHK
jgi:hypothetical protein